MSEGVNEDGRAVRGEIKEGRQVGESMVCGRERVRKGEYRGGEMKEGRQVGESME